MFNSVDPYISIKVAGNTTRKTKTIKGSLNPVFTTKNSFIFSGKVGDWVECTVMDWDPISSDEVVIKVRYTGNADASPNPEDNPPELLQGSVQLTEEILEGGETTVPFQVGGISGLEMVDDGG